MVLIDLISKPWKAIVAFDNHVLSIVPDAVYLKAYCRAVSGQILNLDNPATYCDKLNWLKIHDRNPLYGKMVDKLAARDYIRTKCGDEYLIPLLGVYSSATEIDFTKLPNRFVLKCNHDSGSAIICKNKEKINEKTTRQKLDTALKLNFGRKSRETPYSFIKNRRIIAEEYIYGDEDIAKKPDFKFFCFDGKVKMFQINIGRTSETGIKVNFYNRNQELLDIIEPGGYEHAIDFALPENINEMISLAEALSAGIPHVRVDFLVNDKRIYFSEFTFYHCGGFFPFSPDRWNYEIGSWIHLPEITK